MPYRFFVMRVRIIIRYLRFLLRESTNIYIIKFIILFDYLPSIEFKLRICMIIVTLSRIVMNVGVIDMKIFLMALPNYCCILFVLLIAR